MKDPMEYLLRDELLNADIIDALSAEKTRLVYSEDDGVVIRFCDFGFYAISVSDENAMRKAAELIEEENFMAVIRPFRLLPVLFEEKGRCGTESYYQASYRSKNPVAEPEIPGFSIKPLTEEHIGFVCKNYDDDPDYIKRCIKVGMLGAFDEKGNCAGFIGLHGEEAIGLLRVIPEYRRLGIGSVLEARMINRRLEAGRIPYCHVAATNEKSRGLQKKLGLEFSDKLITWVFKGI